mgnify:CR=1 FL=1
MATFALKVNDSIAADKLVVTASGLVPAGCKSWKVELHDRTWPASKTLKYETKPTSNEANWKTLTMSIRPHAAGRVVAWRAQAVTGAGAGPWTEWAVVDLDAERKKSKDSVDAPWVTVFGNFAPAA